jgi:hypothetical protein
MFLLQKLGSLGWKIHPTYIHPSYKSTVTRGPQNPLPAPSNPIRVDGAGLWG